MTTEAKVQLTSSELGSLWMVYESTSARLKMYDFFKDKTIDKEAQNLLTDHIIDAQNVTSKIVNVFNNENAVIPLGFNESDVVKQAPPLFDDIFHIMFLRQMVKLNLGNNAVHSTMSYMKEINDIFKLGLDIANKSYMMTTNYLLRKGVLARPPYVTMPTKVEFIEDKNYMSGTNLFSSNRPLNTIELGFINQAIEDNIFSMQLLTGFAQVAKESEVKEYFIEGKELAKKVVTSLSAILLEGDIQPPSTWAGKTTESTQPPFSDKLMLYINGLIFTTALGFTSLGTPFNMRSDLPLKLALISKDALNHTKKGSKIMIKHKWMEEPPQMEDRNLLTK